MRVKDFIRRLNELAATAGDDTEVVLEVPREDDGPRIYDRCRPELIDVRAVVDQSFIPGEHFRDPVNDDSDEDLERKITIGLATMWSR